MALLMLLPAASFATEAYTAADTLFTGGVIYTVDAQNTIAQALAVKDGRIVFVGSDAEAAAYLGEETVAIDLEGRFMMPGLIDSHIHSIMPSFFDFSLLGITTLEDTVASIAAYIEENPDKGEYNGFGYMTSLFTGDEGEKGPRKERLDEICPDKPLGILSFDGHAMWVNSKYLEVYGITYETESPKGGVLEKDDEAKAVWGTLKDAAIALGNPEPYDHETLRTELPTFLSSLNSYGYTSIMTLPAFGTMPVPFDAYRALEDEGLLTMRVHGATSVMDFRWEEDIGRMLETKEKYESNLVKMNTVKFFMDGVVDARTAYLLEPYNDVDSLGMVGWDTETLSVVYAKVNEAGFQIHTHAIGDGALRMSLDALEYAKENAPEGDYRNAITHLQVVNGADIPRLGELGVVAVSQPFWHYKAPEYWDVVEYAAIGERAEHMYPMKSFQDTGAVITASSDYPVTADPNPFVAMEVGVTRNLPGNAEELAAYGLQPITDMDDPAALLWPEERLTIQDMIRAYTANGAYLLFAEDETGSLEVGKQADMVILDKNLLEIAPLEIHTAQVLATYMGGQLVYEAETGLQAQIISLYESAKADYDTIVQKLSEMGALASDSVQEIADDISAEFSAIGEKIESGELARIAEAQLIEIKDALTEAGTLFSGLLATAGEELDTLWVAVSEGWGSILDEISFFLSE